MAAARGILSCAAVAVWLLSGSAGAWADGPADNQPDNVRRVPKLGLEVPAAARQTLEAGLTERRQLMQRLRTEKAPCPVLRESRR